MFTIRAQMRMAKCRHWHPTDETSRCCKAAADRPERQLDVACQGVDCWFVHAHAQGGATSRRRRETIIQVHGMGPFEVTYVNAGDDPRRSDIPRAGFSTSPRGFRFALFSTHSSAKLFRPAFVNTPSVVPIANAAAPAARDAGVPEVDRSTSRQYIPRRTHRRRPAVNKRHLEPPAQRSLSARESTPRRRAR